MVKESEAGFQRAVEEAAAYAGWTCIHVSNSERDDAGRLDLQIGNYRRGRVVFAELKTSIGKTSAAQRLWLDMHAAAGHETYLWRPEHFDEITLILNASQTEITDLVTFMELRSVWVMRDATEHEADQVKALEERAKRARRARAAKGRARYVDGNRDAEQQ